MYCRICQAESAVALQHMHAIARVFISICADQVDAYWLCLKFLMVNQLTSILVEPVVC